MNYDSSFGQFMHNVFGGFDLAVFSGFGAVQNDIFTIIAKFFTAFGEPVFGIMLALLSCVLLLFKRSRKIGFMLLFGVVLFYLINNMFLKHVLLRMRPYNALQGNPDFFAWYMNVGAVAEDPYCFPSGHTCYAFTMCTIVFFWLKNDMKKSECWMMFIIAALIGFSRIYLMVHYPTDVIFAAVEGVAFGAFVWYSTSFIQNFCENSNVLTNLNNNIDLELKTRHKHGRPLNSKTCATIVVLIILGFTITGFLKMNSSYSDLKRCEYRGTDFVCMNGAEIESQDELTGEIHWYCEQHK